MQMIAMEKDNSSILGLDEVVNRLLCARLPATFKEMLSLVA